MLAAAFAHAAVCGLTLLLHEDVATPPSDQMQASPSSENKGNVPRRRLSYWDHGQPRFFVSSRIEGGLYVKPQIAVGYGKPYWINTTAEVFGISTFSFGAGYAGLRGSLPFLDLRLGTRYTFSYDRSFLPPKDSFVSSDVADANGPRAHYLTLEAELSGAVPFLGGYVFPVLTLYGVTDAPPDRFLFEESLRGVMKPPVIWAARLGYVKNFGKNDFIKAGAISEFVFLPGRDSNIVRLGPAIEVQITDHLSARGALTVVVASPDSLGLWHGSFAVLGATYRWATGDERPRFP